MTDNPGEWTYRWKNMVRPTRTPGLYQLQGGGYLFRRMVTDPTTGKEREVKRVMRDADENTAILEMQKAVLEKKAKSAPSQLPRQRFASCAMIIFADKQGDGSFKSAAGIDKWEDTLAHLIGGTPPPLPEDETSRRKQRKNKIRASGMRVSGLGEVWIDMLEQPLKDWRKGIQGLIVAGVLAPTTANSWLAILKVLTKAIAEKWKLPEDPGIGVKKFDESEHATYSEEEPNALPPERVGEFLGLMFEHYPQHYGMVYLGFVTGLRPSSMRPLRRRDPESDIKWDRGRLVVRKSQTLGKRVMKSTKQGTQYGIDLPKDVMDVLQWHVDTQLRRPEQKASDLLFPSEVGGFRARSVLDKPFNEIAKKMKLGFRFTARGMRRTFQDMHRLAKIEPLVTRSISGHGTEKMQAHYSTVQNAEQRQGIAQVIQLFGPEAPPQGTRSNE